MRGNLEGAVYRWKVGVEEWMWRGVQDERDRGDDAGDVVPPLK